MEAIKTKRVCELKKGDKFLLFGLERIVTKVTAVEVMYKSFQFDNTEIKYFGAKSQQKVEIIK